jgi:hypothetical protein
VLEPADALEPAVKQNAGNDDKAHHEWIAAFPLQLWHELEIHAVPAEYHGWYGQDGTPAGQTLDHLVLPDGGLGQRHLHGGVNHFPHAVSSLRHAGKMVQDIPVINTVLLWDDVAMETQQLHTDVNQRNGGRLQRQQLILQVVEVLQIVRLRLLIKQRLLERPKPVLQVVHTWLVVVNNEVDDGIKHIAGAAGQAARHAFGRFPDLRVAH